MQRFNKDCWFTLITSLTVCSVDIKKKSSENEKKKLWKWPVNWSFSELFFLDSSPPNPPPPLHPKSEKKSRKSINKKKSGLMVFYTKFDHAKLFHYCISWNLKKKSKSIFTSISLLNNLTNHHKNEPVHDFLALSHRGLANPQVCYSASSHQSLNCLNTLY